LELDCTICYFLKKENKLTVQDAETIYTVIQDKKFIPQNVQDNIFTYILQSTENVMENSELVEEAKTKIEILESKIQDVDGKVVLSSLAV
jgi:hypothetical protein